MKQHAAILDKQVVKSVRLGYLLWLPDGYEAHEGKSWPLILFLHGRGERGADVQVPGVDIPATLVGREHVVRAWLVERYTHCAAERLEGNDQNVSAATRERRFLNFGVCVL